jgi:ATP-dependent RNA helicase HelY
VTLDQQPFELDGFQIEAIRSVDAGRSVLVSAPTGSGKTIVAEHAVRVALASSTRAFYTTPIKALSNQKYHDLVEIHGVDRVGLLTGDTSINGDAPVVVMTTEVLRNMIHTRSHALDGLSWVVLDEVHYLQDAYRGSVWEEIIIHLPRSVRLVCLSATVSNAPELAQWIETVRGATDVVVETQRPVTLDNWFLADDRHTGELVMIETLLEGEPNPDGHRFDSDQRDVPRNTRGGRPQRRWATPGRTAVIELLAARDMLPALYFIFSRAACEDAVRSCMRSGLSFTTADERFRIREIAEHHVANLTDDDLRVLEYDRWLSALESGVAAHHAGMVPPFKEAVEKCFIAGLVRVVFATETLALGINMPARSVVIEKLTKYTGDGHDFLTAAQFTQLTGRAGRRGIDAHGHAIVLWSPFVTFQDSARLVASRSFRLTSSFRPTYNIAANLVRRHSADEAHRLLSLSFAQYQADADIVRLEAHLATRRETLEELQSEARCDRGDLIEYRRLLDRGRGGKEAGGTTRGPSSSIEQALRKVKPGDVLVLDHLDNHVAVLSVSQRRGGGTRVKVISPRRQVLTIGASDLAEPPDVVGTINLPVPFTPSKTSFQKQVVAGLTRVSTGRPRKRSSDGGAGPSRGIDAHPVHGCPKRDAHLRALRRATRVADELRSTEERIRNRADSLAEVFDRVLQVLEEWGHLDGWALSEKGEQLVRIFHECDLLIAEALVAGLFDDVDAPTVAGLASCFIYEHRNSAPEITKWFPSRDVASRADSLMNLAVAINGTERRLGLPPTRQPDATFFPLAHAWSSGEAFDRILDDDDLSGGDFVRTIKQLIDLLRQMGDAAPVESTATAARVAADSLFRGVVSASAPASVASSSVPIENVDDIDPLSAAAVWDGGAAAQ